MCNKYFYFLYFIHNIVKKVLTDWKHTLTEVATIELTIFLVNF